MFKHFNPPQLPAFNQNKPGPSLSILKIEQKMLSVKNNNYEIGINSLANRLYYINNQVPLEWLNMSMNMFKIHCKKRLLIM